MPDNAGHSPEGLDPLIQGLLRPEAYSHPVQGFQVLETHISWVILTGDYAYKLKKPVNFGFVDFTTLEKRRFCCDEELRLNRRQTNDLYLAVQPIFGPRDQATFLGTGEPIEYAVQMRQFSQSQLLTEVLMRGELSGELLDRLACDVADFQQTAATATPDDPFGSGPVIRQVMDDNLMALEQAGANSAAMRQLADWVRQEFPLREMEFARRKSAGKVREGHGDMHLGNMILRRDRIEVFDCLEFNPALRWIDVVSEVAFLVMDLADRRRPDLGGRFLNAWLEQTGDYEGLGVWAWYYCYRALVRAKVACLRRRQSDVSTDEAQRLDSQLTDYLQLALAITHRPRPRLIITQGVSGSGKSYSAQRLAADFGLIRIRSDVERKRMFGQGNEPAQKIGALYGTEATEQTYLRLRNLAADIMRSGWSVIVDATFLRRSQREPFRDLAKSLDVECCVLAFHADRSILEERIQQRQRAGADPSDATVEVLAGQLQRIENVEPSEGWTVLPVETGQPDSSEHLASAFNVWVNSRVS